jgi:hypothetical protein
LLCHQAGGFFGVLALRIRRKDVVMLGTATRSSRRMRWTACQSKIKETYKLQK